MGVGSGEQHPCHAVFHCHGGEQDNIKECSSAPPFPPQINAMQCLVGTEVFSTQRADVLAAPSVELQLPPRTTGTEMLSSGWFPVSE